MGDARSLSLPERFGLVAMLDQAFKYLLTHEDHLACLSRVREHLRDDGRFLVEHRCFFRLPTAADETPYEFRWREGDWVGVDTYDPVQQVHLSAYQPADDPEGPTLVEPIRDFTWQELSLLHHVSGFVLEEVWHDLDERAEPVDYFDGAFLWTKRQA